MTIDHPCGKWWPGRGWSVEAEIEVRRSRFRTRLARVDSEDEARAVIADVRSTYPDARHHCSAFVVEVPGARPIERSSDDGEPSGTAGMPMLAVLRGAEASQVVAIVTRWFGGVLLGTGGLVRAYSDAVTAALDITPRVRPVVRELVRLELRPDEAGRVHGALLQRGFEVVDTHWGAGVTLTLAVTDPDTAAALVREVLQRPARLFPAGLHLSEELFG